MCKLITILGSALVATSALADDMASSPAYLGNRSNNPEQETYGTPVDGATFAKTLAFIGPARSVGQVTGEPEKDTFGYRPLFVDQQERGLQSGTSHLDSPQDRYR